MVSAAKIVGGEIVVGASCKVKGLEKYPSEVVAIGKY